MRRLAFLVVLLLPGVAAEVLIEDARGDGAYHVGFPPITEPLEAGSGAKVDLLAVRAWQDGRFLLMEVEQAEPLRDSLIDPSVDLSIAGTPIRAYFWTWNPFDDGFFKVYLRTDESEVVSTGYIDEERRVWGAKVLLNDLGKLGIDPKDGDLVEVRGASAYSAYLVEDGQTREYNGEYDRAPDGLDSEAAFALVLPEKSVGGLSLRSPLAMRTSNGAATVFVYDVALLNTADAAVQVVWAVTEVPDGWQVVAPPPVPLEAGDATTAGVLVAMPSRHVHGEAESFVLRAEAGPGRWAETRLGVHFPDIPEPSGHHPRVNVAIADANDPIPPEGMDPYFGNLAFLSLTTLEPSPEGEPVRGLSDGSVWFWSGGTERMSLGADADLRRSGMFEAAFVSPIGMKHVEVLVEVTFSAGEGDAWRGGVVGAGTAHIGTLPINELVAVEVPLAAEPSGDLVPAGPEGRLWLRARMTGTPDLPVDKDDGVPHLAPGATMLLPLLEYHDPVEQRFSRGDALDLSGDGSHRIVPEGTAIFNVTVHNAGDASHDVLVQTISTVAVPRILGDASFRLAAGDSRTVHVAMDAPAAGQADAVVLITSQTDPEQRQAMLVRAIVDPLGRNDAAAVADLAQGSHQRSPGMPLLLLGAVLAAAALVRRR